MPWIVSQLWFWLGLLGCQPRGGRCATDAHWYPALQGIVHRPR